jgi:hypothetical protein
LSRFFSQAQCGYNAAWRQQPKHFFILSEAGKPIYSRHGDEDELSSLMAVMQECSDMNPFRP